MHPTQYLALILLLSVSADGRQKAPTVRPTDDPRRVLLEKNGYVAVPLTEEDEGGRFTVPCKSGSETWRMMLDSGSENSSLDFGVVKKLGLKHQGEVIEVGIGGSQKSVNVSLRGLSIGEFDTRAVANTIGFHASAFPARNPEHKQLKLRTDGLLGHGALYSSAAVIDYPARMLYLRTPLAGLCPEVEGKWIAVGGQEDGRERVVDPKAPPSLEFKDSRFHMVDGGRRYDFGLHVKQRENGGYKLVFFDPKQEYAEKLDYQAAGLLKVTGDKLTVCLCLDLANAKSLPEDFAAPEKSGLLVLEFRREKPRGDRPTGPADSLRALLEKKGYVAVPLAQEGGGCFTVKCKSGSEALRLVLDTGAEVAALDTKLVKRLGLKPKQDIIAVGSGGTVVGGGISLRGLMIDEFDTRAVLNTIPAAAVDFSPMNAARLEHRKLPPIDGLLGHQTLTACEAVIDYSTRTLYLRKPLDGLWPEIEGKWVAVSGQDDGEDKRIDPKTPPRLEFKDRLFGLTYGGKFYRFGMHVMPGKDHYTIALFNPWQELDGELDYRAGGLMKVGGDKLILCLLLNPTKTKGKMPEEFKSAAGSGHILLEFRREK
jgi:predicted aspartyl protease